MGSIKSSFKFESYKVDSLQFQMKKTLGLLGLMGNINPNAWDLNISIRQPVYNLIQKKYIGGMDISLSLLNPPKSDDNENDQEKSLIDITCGIAGIFSVEEERLDKVIEQQLVKIQIPALLFPYLRATITSLMANAGFGSVILPLVNIHEIAKKIMGDLEVRVVE